MRETSERFKGMSREQFIKRMRRDARYQLTYNRNTIDLAQGALDWIEKDRERGILHPPEQIAELRLVIETCEGCMSSWKKVLRSADELEAQSRVRLVKGEGA